MVRRQKNHDLSTTATAAAPAIRGQMPSEAGFGRVCSCAGPCAATVLEASRFWEKNILRATLRLRTLVAPERAPHIYIYIYI